MCNRSEWKSNQIKLEHLPLLPFRGGTAILFLNTFSEKLQ